MEDYVTAEEGTEEYWQLIAEFDLIMMDWNIAAHDYAKTSTSPYSQMMIGQNMHERQRQVAGDVNA